MIEIVKYNQDWPSEYNAIAKLLRENAGDEILAVHHIGSTSIPGLAAKDIIDIQVPVEVLSKDFEASIVNVGFVRGQPAADHDPPGQILPAEQMAKQYYRYSERPAHIHVREEGRFNHRYAFLCRDYLRAHSDAAKAYEEVKRQLAIHFTHDKTGYCAIKDPVFDVIMAGAEAWAQRTSWSIPASD